MIKVVTSGQMRAIDSRTIEEMKIPGIVLMENAASAVVAAILERYPAAGLKVSVFAGKGNNGGDGLAVARRLMNMGATVTVFLLASREEVRGDAAVNLAAFTAMGGAVKEISEERHFNNFKLKFMHATVMVDALLGTGISAAPRGLVAETIRVINQSRAFKVAVDTPSGMDSDSGHIPGECVAADVTVTFGLPKVGLVTFPARGRAGKVIIADISIPAIVTDQSPCAGYLMEADDILERLPLRRLDAHKGGFGHLLMACGSVGMGGTAVMAGLAALRMGAGLVTAGAPEGLCAAYEAGAPEMMALPLPQTAGGAISGEAVERFLKFSEGKTAVLIGPGLGLDESTARFVRGVCNAIKAPLVIDADGLNLLGQDLSVIKNRQAPTIITPHPGEMARLTGETVARIQADRLGAAKALAKKTGAVVVLKGAGTIIAGPEEVPRININGNQGLATGGSGDALAGMIAGLLAQGAAPEAAADAGVWLHGRCADIYEINNDPRSLIATDIFGLIPRALSEVTRPNQGQQ
ncbi:MAG: NAD(P)H-hydrate dehydratase [Nitrospinota bacterium]|nr:NAD(P)H-hydrate dehydratase [Nitrospinota bacterium]